MGIKCPKCQFENPDNKRFCGECGTRIIPSAKPPESATKTLEVSREELTPGSTFAGRFRIIEELGRGGMGKVYKVYDTEIREKVALKLLRPEISGDEKGIERFRSEIKLARKIAHRNVCRMYDLGEAEGNRYITMEYVPGEDLKSTIQRIGQLPLGKSISIAKQIFGGLAEASRLGVIHRDLKPSNIMLDSAGNVRIMDFGIARFQKSQGITEPGTMIGTPEYMSPEQVDGQETETSSDIYSTGVILYEMLTGVVPFEGTTPLSIAVKHKTEYPREPKKFNPQIPDELNRLVLKCMEKKRERRYQNPAEVLSELKKIEKQIPTKEMILEGKASFFWAFIRKLKERKILETMAIFIGSGVALIEFAHHILVNHYNFPKGVVDFIVITLSVAMISTVTWRWFYGEKIRRYRAHPFHRVRLKWIIAIAIVIAIIFGGYRIWKGIVLPKVEYEDYILLEVNASETQKIQNNLVRYMLLRALEASTESRILVQEDFVTYKKRTELQDVKPSRPIIAVYADVSPKRSGFEGYDIQIEMDERGKKLSHKFECKGPNDLVSSKINDIHAFISENTSEKIGNIEGNKAFSQICSDNPDALNKFLEGKEAWDKLNPVPAHDKYEKATEIDSEFSLAYLRLAEVQIWRGYREEAEKNLEIAEEKQGKLIKNDMYRLKALQGRIDFEPSKERQNMRRLVEDFPFKKEYRYELAEAYFNYGEADEAIKHYKRALELDREFSHAHNHMALCYAWIGNHTKAEEHLKRYVELDQTANSYDSLASGYMFAGQYDKALTALDIGRKKEDLPDYLYGNMARNFILKGALVEAAESLKKQSELAENPDTIENIKFYSAYIEFLRGDLEKASQVLRPVVDYYTKPKFDTRVEESPNLPFWLSGVIAFRQQNMSKLSEMIEKMETRFVRHREKTGSEINATNYFAIYKYYLHLKLLEAFLQNDENGIARYIEESKKIKKKMGYWASMFNQTYFFNTYAEILLRLNRTDQAMALLKEAVAYNPNYAEARLNLAKIHYLNNDLEVAREEYKRAEELLSDADEDYILIGKHQELRRFLSIESNI